MFKPQFVPMILDGTKKSTFRPIGKRLFNEYPMTKLDMRIWTGRPYVSPQQKFATALTYSIRRFGIIPAKGRILIPEKGRYVIDVVQAAIEDIAQMDGFKNAEQFFDFFRNNYKGETIEMNRIIWQQLRPATTNNNQ
jgi:hypothetical protein